MPGGLWLTGSLALLCLSPSPAADGTFSFKYSPGKLRGNQYKSMMTKEELEEEQRYVEFPVSSCPRHSLEAGWVWSDLSDLSSLGCLGLKASMVQTSATQEDVRPNQVLLIEEVEALWPCTPLELLKLPLCMLRPNVPADARGCSSPWSHQHRVDLHLLT